MAFPTDLSAVVDNVDDVLAAHINALETKMGIDASAVVTALDYMLRTGWVTIGDSWSYASATTITVPSGATVIYGRGDKIRLKQGGGYKYWVIKDVANALLTIIQTDDYTLADASITDNSFSHVDKPVGFPSRFTWTPTYTGFSTDPTEKIDYTVVAGRIFITFYSNSGVSNAAAFDFTLPVAEVNSTGGYAVYPACIQDNGSWQTVMGVVGIFGTTAKVGIDLSTSSGNAFGGFTASGNKAIYAGFSYPI